MHHLKQRALLPIIFFAVDVGANCLERQRTLHKNHLAVFPMRNTLRFEVHRLNLQHVVRHQLAGKYLAGSTGLPWRRISKCNFT